MSLLPEINQASAEINKFVAQANIHQTIAPVNSAEFTSPADTTLLASRDPVIREVSVGMTGIEAVQNTVSGTPPLSLPNSIGKPLKAWSVDVVPNQEGTGDPSPSNVRAIHGTDKINLYCGSPNIWDEEWEAGRYNPSTGEPTAEPGIRSKNFIPVEVGKSYYLYCGSQVANDFRLLYYDDNKTLLSASSWTTPNTVITLTTTASYIKFYIATAYGSVYKNDVAFNYPATVTTYNSHQGGITSITLPQTVYTGTIGSEGGESRTGVYTFTGNESWSRQWESQSAMDKYYTSAPNNGYLVSDAKLPADNTKSVPIKTSIGNFDASYYGLENHTNTICIAKDARFGITADLYNPNGGTLAGVQVEYELATPTTFAVPSVTIPTPTGTATTWATAEDGTVDGMEVTYYKSE